MFACSTAFWHDTVGATSLEHAIIAGSLSILVFAGAFGIGDTLANKYFVPAQQGLS